MAYYVNRMLMLQISYLFKLSIRMKKKTVVFCILRYYEDNVCMQIFTTFAYILQSCLSSIFMWENKLKLFLQFNQLLNKVDYIHIMYVNN